MSTPEWMLTDPDAGVDERPDYGRADVAEAAVQRLLDFAGYWDSGVVAVTDGHTLHVRDIEGIVLLVRDALLRIPADGMTLEYIVQWTDAHGDARTDSATSRETAYYMAEALRAVQGRQHRLPDACVKVRAVGPLMDDTPPET